MFQSALQFHTAAPSELHLHKNEEKLENKSFEEKMGTRGPFHKAGSTNSEFDS